MASAADTTIVLLHGLGLDSRMWDTIVPRLRDRGGRVIAHDLPGHGGGGPLGETTLQEMAWSVRAFVEQQERPVHLVGFSLGGMLAMRIALSVALAALTLVSTSGEVEPHRERYEKMAALFRTLPPSIEGADTYLAMQMRPEWAHAHPAVRDRYRRMVMESDRDGVYHAACAVIRRESILERLRELRVPTSILAGTADVATPIDHARRVAEAISGARLVLFEGAPHLLHEERPDEVVDSLMGV